MHTRCSDWPEGAPSAPLLFFLCFVFVVGVRAQQLLPQTITWLSPTQQVLTPNLRFPVSATSSSGLPLTFSIEHGPAVIEDGNLIVTGIGSVHVIALQSGNAEFEPTKLQRTFNVPTVLLTTAAVFRPGTGNIFDLAVEGDYAFLATDAPGMFIIDVKDTSNPKQAGFFAASQLRAIKIMGNY